MSLILIVALIVMAVNNSKLRKKLNEIKHYQMMSGQLGQNGQTGIPTLEYSPEIIGQEAENLRRAAENALRTKAEALLPMYEKSELVRDLLVKIQEAMGTDDLLWDAELNDNEIVLTTMTDSMDNRLVLIKEFYDFQSLGYEVPSRESSHRLALALALQKGLGGSYGINYQFRYNPADGSHVMSQLSVSFRQKQAKGTPLKSPLQAAEME